MVATGDNGTKSPAVQASLESGARYCQWRFRRRARFQGALTQLSADNRAQYEKKLAEVDKQHRGDPPATIKDFVDHIDYAVKLLGIDHVEQHSAFVGSAPQSVFTRNCSSCKSD
jgi:microsomal dipeptidase-like Zn-dependent dipeptidase